MLDMHDAGVCWHEGLAGRLKTGAPEVAKKADFMMLVSGCELL